MTGPTPPLPALTMPRTLTGPQITRLETFIKLEPILEILRACIYSGRVAGEKPVSVILVAEQESAKTEALKYFRGTHTLRYLSDITSRGMTAYTRDIESNKLRHIVILDLIRVVSHGQGVTNRTIQTLSSYIEEGESETSDAGGTRGPQGMPVIGCLMSLTPAYYIARAGNWRKSGFLSRFLPVRFKYTKATIHEIHKAIRDGHKLPEPRAEAIPEAQTFVTLLPRDAEILARKAEALGEANRLYGFRYHRALRSLAKGEALVHKRSTIAHEDIAKVLEWAEFFSDREIEL